MDSKVDELLRGMRDEEGRLRDELANTEKRTKKLKGELDKVLSAIKALGGKQSGGKKRRKSRSPKKQDSAAAGFSSPEVDREPESEMSFSD